MMRYRTAVFSPLKLNSSRSRVDQRAGQGEGPRIAPSGRPFDRRAARKRQAQQAGDLVERLAGRVVDRASQQFEFQRRCAAIQAGVAAADDQAQARKDVASGGQAAGVDVGLQMIDGHQRQASGQAQGLGGRQADQQRTGQPRRVGDRDRVELIESDAGPAQRLVDDRQDPLDVRPRCDLRHHAAESLVQMLLRGDDRREDLELVGHDRRRRFVARALEDQELLHARFLASGRARKAPLSRRPAASSVELARAGVRGIQ